MRGIKNPEREVADSRAAEKKKKKKKGMLPTQEHKEEEAQTKPGHLRKTRGLNQPGQGVWKEVMVKYCLSTTVTTCPRETN